MSSVAWRHHSPGTRRSAGHFRMSILIILCGQPYAGKTTLGQAIVEKFGYAAVDVDVTKEHFYGQGLKDDDLSHEQWVRIYEETDQQIADYLQGGRSVVDDSRNF